MVLPETGTLQISDVIGDKDKLADHIANQYHEWNALRQTWLHERKEVLQYVFATDTMSTTADGMGWKNSTHLPKLCQIRDNLHANYMATLFPTDRPFKWEGDDDEAESVDTRVAIESYMHNKLRRSGFMETVSRLVYDWIDYGTCYAMPESIYEEREDPTSGQMVPGYIGPNLVRISPVDIVFNPAASSFENTAKIIKSVKTLGALKREIQDKPEMKYLEAVFDKMMDNRKTFRGHSETDFMKDDSFQMAGFSSWYSYFTSDLVEILNFYGDIYNEETGELQTNRVVTIVDRQYVLRNEPNPSWHHSAPIFDCGWRLRPDSLVAQGPLDNLVGMQYRMDHLENAKADAYDLIVHPVMKIVGYVEEFEYGPGAEIHVGDEGDVDFLRPDVTMLSADTQIELYENKMEEMVGAPKQAMGFRSPGEKTKYEVQVLENGANRIFLNKTAYFEEYFLEKCLNAMLEDARRNMSAADVIRVTDDDTGAVEFMNISPESIRSSGKIYPIGARHFQRDANMLQNLTQLSASPILQDPSISNHLSGKKMAKAVETLLGLEKYKLYSPNIRISEQMESQQKLSAAQQVLGEQGALPAGPEAEGAAPQGAPQ